MSYRSKHLKKSKRQLELYLELMEERHHERVKEIKATIEDKDNEIDAIEMGEG